MKALFALARPRMLPFIWLLVLGGYGFAHWDRALMGRGGGALLLALLAWTLLHAGTMWLNAALDRDEGEVLWGEAAAVPPTATAWGYGALLACVVVGWAAGPAVGACSAGCALLAVLYSHPATVWKAHPLGGPLVNGLGYGLLSPIAGFSAAGVSPTWRALAVLGLGLCGVMAAYYAAQAFQEDEDRERGYRTLAARKGGAAAVQAVRLWTLLGLGGAVLLAAAGWVPRPMLVFVPAAVWLDRYLVAWRDREGGPDSAGARGYATRLFSLCMLGLALLFAVYLRASYRDEPVAGLNTAAGHPPDRPLLSPLEMRRWEAIERQRARQGIDGGSTHW